MTNPELVPGFTPIRILEADISRPLPDITPAVSRDGGVYTRAWALVRLHDAPLGMIELDLPDGELAAGTLARTVWEKLHAEINDHLRADGIAPLAGLDAAGVPFSATPPCLLERERAVAGSPLISVIIATRDRTESLANCLAAFEHVEYPNYEIVVVDNAPSNNGTETLMASRFSGHPRIRYVKELHPGLGWAHNCGLAHARGTYIAFTDDDVIVDRHWLSELMRGFALGANVGCVSGLVVPQEIETPAQFLFDAHSGFSKGYRRRVYDMRANRPEDRLFPYRASMFGTGANMAYRADALRSVGALDPVFGTGEDLDIFFRIVDAGYQLVYQPTALVHHVHRADYAALRKQFYSYGTGFTSYLTKQIVANPLDGMRLMARLPAAVAFSRSRTTGHIAEAVEYPEELTKVELKGRLYGPFTYLRSLWNYRRTLRRDRRTG